MKVNELMEGSPSGRKALEAKYERMLKAAGKKAGLEVIPGSVSAWAKTETTIHVVCSIGAKSDFKKEFAALEQELVAKAAPAKYLGCQLGYSGPKKKSINDLMDRFDNRNAFMLTFDFEIEKKD